MKPVFTVGAFGIISDSEERILLCLRNDYELWNLPGGTVEHGETPWDCVIREIEEETGYNTEIERLIGIYAKPESNDIVFSFKCNILSGNLTLNEEAKEIKYFDYKELPRNTAPKQVERIIDYFENRNSVIMKSQIGKSVVQLLKEGYL